MSGCVAPVGRRSFCLALLVLSGCAQKSPPPGAAGPAEAVQDFAGAVQRGDSATAWALLSARTQADADRIAKAAQPDGGDGRAMLFGSALPQGSIEVGKVQESGDSADVQTSSPDGGPGHAFHVVREAGRWRIDLPLTR
ncbi:MAG TPA: hypothetical protein VGH20_13605 [Myxococcales bacterium]|jgi:hypothetical protein